MAGPLFPRVLGFLEAIFPLLEYGGKHPAHPLLGAQHLQFWVRLALAHDQDR